jgi:hypothetical protein
MKRTVRFSDNNEIYYTYSKTEYDRSNNEMDTVFLLSRDFNHQIKIKMYQELNYFKKHEMIMAHNTTYETL